MPMPPHIRPPRMHCWCCACGWTCRKTSIRRTHDDQAEASAADAAAAATVAFNDASLLSKPSSSVATPSELDAMFAQDSANIREWMRHAVEAGLADAVVVSSATTLAVRFLQRRYRYPALSCVPSGNRRQRSARAGVLSELVAVTCLHLASKYHCVNALELETLGRPSKVSTVFDLGE